jgi:FMN-dependent NADH-azoreductase
MFDLANGFKTYDKIIVAAPIWDLSFPSILKIYFENISVSNITFRYESSGLVGLAKAKEFIYLATAGGFLDEFNLGYLYTKDLFKMFGINNSKSYILNALDIDINKKEEVFNEKLNELFKKIEG